MLPLSWNGNEIWRKCTEPTALISITDYRWIELMHYRYSMLNAETDALQTELLSI